MTVDTIRLNTEGVKRAKAILSRNGFTQKTVAEKTGVSRSTVSRFLDGLSVIKPHADEILDFLGMRERDDLIDSGEVIFFAGHGETVHVNNFVVNDAAQEISETSVDDVQGIASAQLRILDSYYKEGLTQAKTSFRWAATVSGIGFVFFLTAVVFVLNKQPKDRTLIPLISGAVIEVVAGINFYLYGQATKQLSSFQHRLDQTQRFLLANSICESLEGDGKQTARVELVKTVSSIINQSD